MSSVPPPPPPPPPPPSYGSPDVFQPGLTSSEKLTPSVAGVWIGVALMVIGIVAGAVISIAGFLRVADRVDTFPRLTVPDAKVMSFSKAGTYIVYIEYDPKGDEPAIPPSLTITVTDEAGSPLTVERYVNDLSFSFSGTDVKAGKAAFRFRLPASGNYTVESAGDVPAGMTLLVGSSVLRALVRPLLIGLAVGGVLFIVGLVLFIMTLVKRRRARKARQASPYDDGWSGGYPAVPTPFTTPAPPPPGQWNPPSVPPRTPAEFDEWQA